MPRFSRRRGISFTLRAHSLRSSVDWIVCVAEQSRKSQGNQKEFIKELPRSDLSNCLAVHFSHEKTRRRALSTQGNQDNARQRLINFVWPSWE